MQNAYSKQKKSKFLIKPGSCFVLRRADSGSPLWWMMMAENRLGNTELYLWSFFLF
jgi:hypothetical protein